MKRTIKQYTKKLTKEQLKEWNKIVIPYNKQVDAFLVEFSHLKFLNQITNRAGRDAVRNKMVSQKFVSPFGIQGRQWKMALLDALETITKQWESAVSFVKTDYLYRNENLSDDERHYANWLLYKTKKGCQYDRIISILKNKDITHTTIKLDVSGRKKTRHYLKRCFGKVMKNRPRVKLARRISCDTQLYRINWNKERKCQVLDITTTKPRKMLFIDLKGFISGKSNAKIVYDSIKNILEVHQTRDVKKKRLGKEVSAADYGMSEALTDEKGNQYGKDLWRRLSCQNKYLLEKGRNRNKVVQLMKKTNDIEKKKRFEKMLSSENRDRIHLKNQESVKNEINRAFRHYFSERKVSECGFEDLTGMSGKTKYKGLSRMVSLWTRGFLKERLDFLSESFSIKIVHVNPAYTSQECPKCHFVHQKNRRGDLFSCLKCAHKGHADHFAAINIKSRMTDKKIKVKMKKLDVKKVLEERHNEFIVRII